MNDPTFDRTIVYQLVQEGQSLQYNGEDYQSGKARDWYLEASIRYERTFGKHAVTGLLLHNMSKKYYLAQNTAIPRGYLGLVGRATYAYDNKYLVDFNIGYNGSENFHPIVVSVFSRRRLLDGSFPKRISCETANSSIS